MKLTYGAVWESYTPKRGAPLQKLHSTIFISLCMAIAHSSSSRFWVGLGCQHDYSILRPPPCTEVRIQDDEDITMLDTHKPDSSPNYMSSPTCDNSQGSFQAKIRSLQAYTRSIRKDDPESPDLYPEYPGGSGVRTSTRSLRTYTQSIREDDRMSERSSRVFGPMAGVSGFHGVVPPYYGPMGRVPS